MTAASNASTTAHSDNQTASTSHNHSKLNNGSSSSSKARPMTKLKFSLDDARAVYRLASSNTISRNDQHGSEEDSDGLRAKVRHALDVIEQAVDRFSLDRLALSFNGGKDCTVLVHLLAAVALKRAVSQSVFEATATQHAPSSSPTPPLPKLSSVYVRCLSPFPQVESFVKESSDWYNLELEAVEGGMKTALQEYLDKIQQRRTHQGRTDKIDAVLVGTRRNDPHGAQLTPFDPTDKGWPEFMRVHPILDWSYAQIWDFLRHPQLTLGGSPLQWCELYDYGYTSLGSTHNTFPNPLLRIDDGGVGGWRPAWELADGSQERAGRERLADDVMKREQHSVEPESGAETATL
ncbi:hypothetical protein ACM66B_001258 [Microbotryomycetes sp. NB124-2]